jgi:outer membrane protein assembly factor BamD (BamD/ComL family)
MDSNENKSLDSAQPVTTGLETLTDSAREIRSWIITVAIAAVIVLAIFLYRGNRESNENKASRMLGEARNVQALQAVINQYPSTAAARLSLLQAAKAQYDNGDYVTAQATYREFLVKNPGHPMASIAELGLVHCTEGMGQAEQALAAYVDFYGKHKEGFLAPVALFGKARCLKSLKRYGESKATYEDFLVSHPKSEWQGYVEEALKQLERDSRKPGVNM